MGIYEDVKASRQRLEVVDGDNPLLSIMGFDVGRIFYKPEFLERYCGGGLVDDEILGRYLADLRSECEKLRLGS
jgi:hypothetical protein